MEQLSIEHAIAQGERGMRISIEAATRRDPDFAAKVEALFLRHLAAVGSAWGGDLTDIARAHGLASDRDARCFGAIFQGMARRNVIRCVEYGIRRKGNGTAGARRWALVQ